MVTKPYEEDDDAPTLQRRSPASGPAARMGSGVRPAYLLDEEAQTQASSQLDELLDAGFEEEATTAVDRAPLSGALADEHAETATALPADREPTTANLPVDIAAVLRHAAAQSEPPPSPLGAPDEESLLPSALRPLPRCGD